jgi:integrase
MPRQGRGPHLYLKKRGDGESFWYIRDGKSRVATGYRSLDSDGAREALGKYIGTNGRPDFADGSPGSVTVSAVLALYGQDRAPENSRPKEVRARLLRLLDYFGDITVGKITPTKCRNYVKERGSIQAARRELEDLRSAINYAWRSRVLTAIVPIDLPEKSNPRERWLTREEAARMIWAALGWRLAQASDIRTRKASWRLWGRVGERNSHVARFILIGLRTGTRHDAILGLGWHAHTTGGHADLENGLIYRIGSGERRTKKRRPPVPIDGRLSAHLRRWRDMPGSKLFVVSYSGGRMDRMQRAWRSVRALAGLDAAVTPHVLRHTFVTWKLQDGEDPYKVAALAGMDLETLIKTYGHHAPDYLRTKAGAGR